MCLLFALAACNGEDPAPDPIPVEPTPPEQPAVDPDGTPPEPETANTGDPWDGLKGLDKARSLTAARKFRDAVKELEAILSTDPSNGSVWSLLRHAANLGGESGELLDRLDASTAIGGQEVNHWSLRAQLALDAERPADALDSARKLAKADPELGAVYTVLAIQAGATFDTSNLSTEDPHDALVLAATQKGAKQKRTLATTAPSTWQGQLVRAALWDQAGDAEAALADRESALSNEDPYAHVAVAPELVDTVEDARAAELAADAARSASSLGLAVAATDFTLMAVDHYIAAMDPAEGLALATEMRDARAEAKDGPGTAWTNIAVARAAQANGQVDIALAAATDAMNWAETEKDNDALGAASWEVGEAAWLLGLDEPLLAAAAFSDDKKAFETLAAVLNGNTEGAAATLSKSSAVGSDGVLLQLAAARAAWASDKPTAAYTDKAIKLADDGGHTPDRVLARLEKERYARAEGTTTTKVLAELAGIADELDSDALRAEVAVRTLRNGGTATLPEGAGSEWTALAEGTETDGTSLPAQFAKARAQARNGRHEKAYDTYHSAFSKTPVHHRGPWAPISVLDGRSGPGIDQDAALLVDQKNAIPAGLSLLVLHEWWHGTQELDVAFQVGDDPSLALEAEERIAYNASHRHLQARSLLWLCGGEEPIEARKALEDADTKALEDAGFARALPPAMADYRDIRESLGPVAILSYRLGPHGGEALAVTKADAVGIPLKPDAIRKAAVALRTSLATGTASGGGAVSPMNGDVLRVQLLDPFQDVISGTARYLVIPDGPLWGISMSALPEQQAGRRYLADIRTIAYSATVATAHLDYDSTARKYSPEYLGLSVRPESQAIGLDGTRIATETENTGRHFMPDLREIQAGEGATGELLREKMPRARFIHLADLKGGSHGSIAFGDEDEVALHEVREQDLWSLVTILASDVDPRVARRWTQAFHAAGVPDVITTRWKTPLQIRSRYFFAFFENYMQEGEVPRALTGARNLVLAEDGSDFTDPSWWGPYFLSGMP